jgi:GT2 family glycosyltransferase
MAADSTLDVVLGHTQFMQQASCLDVTKNDETSRFTSPLAPRPSQFSEREDGTGETVTLINEPYPQYFLGSALFRRSTFARVGGFDETLRYCDDWDWFLRAQELGVAMQMFQEVALCYRRHQNNLTRSPDSRRELLKLLRKSLVRRRRQGDETFALPEWFDFARRVNANG